MRNGGLASPVPRVLLLVRSLQQMHVHRDAMLVSMLLDREQGLVAAPVQVRRRELNLGERMSFVILRRGSCLPRCRLRSCRFAPSQREHQRRGRTGRYGVVNRRHGDCGIYVGNGGAKSQKNRAFISLISIADGSVLGRIDVRLFVNFRDKNEVGVIDLKTQKFTDSRHVPGPSRNSAMAFDPKTNHLFIGSRSPGKLFVLDASYGAVIHSLDIVDTSDEIIFDGKHRRFYITGAGGLDVLRQINKNHYGIQQHADTLGGKTSVYIPTLKKLYVIHTNRPQATEAGLQVFSVQ